MDLLRPVARLLEETRALHITRAARLSNAPAHSGTVSGDRDEGGWPAHRDGPVTLFTAGRWFDCPLAVWARGVRGRGFEGGAVVAALRELRQDGCVAVALTAQVGTWRSGPLASSAA
jgi:hypothetical protein